MTLFANWARVFKWNKDYFIILKYKYFDSALKEIIQCKWMFIIKEVPSFNSLGKDVDIICFEVVSIDYYVVSIDFIPQKTFEESISV